MVLSVQQKIDIITSKKQGLSNLQISRQVKCAESSVRRFWKKYEEDGSLARRTGGGRKRKTDERTDREIIRMSLRDRFKTGSEIAAELSSTSDIKISKWTANRRLKEAQLQARKPAKKPLLTKKMKAARLRWAKERENWTKKEWKSVIFSDESKFNLIGSDSGVKVRRRPGERYKECCILPTVKHSPYLMVWGAITSAGIGEILILSGTVNSTVYANIINTGVVPTIEQLSENIGHITFQDDGAPCHRSKFITEYKQQLGINSLPWPGNSPDLNLIENVWGIMGRKIQKKKPKTTADLRNIILDIWYNDITPSVIENLYNSMPKRIKAVIKARGGHTKF